MIIGKRLSGRYEILRVIGSGGMSNVYLARDVILERDVAVKLMRVSMANEEQLVRRFRREAQATTQLMHPNIVDIFDVDEDHDNHFIVMEYIAGMDLKAYINHAAPLPLSIVVRMMLQILSAISHAHGQHIIHRDIKPQNVLIDAEGNAKITDFGIAMALFETSMTQTNTTLGSVHYLSPEQARGGVATPKSDVYSLGIMLYEMITGILPFDGESPVAIAIQQLQSPMPLLSDKVPDIPMSLQNIVMKATAKESINRYSTVEEMKEDIATALMPSRINEAPYGIHSADYSETKTIPIQTATIKDKIADIEGLETNKVDEPIIDQKKEKKSNKKVNKKRRWLIIIIAFIAIAGIVGSYFYYTSQKTYAVADVTNISQQAAIARLQKDGFRIGKTTEQNSDKVEKGYIIKTDPEAGEKLKKGDTIDLFISIGKKEFAIDDYRGKNIDDVKEELEKAGFKKVTTTPINSDEIETNEITSQSIQKGLKIVPSETTIELEFSSGPAAITLKDLSGYNKSSVKDYATDNGFELTTTDEFSDKVAEGQVISQTPEAGTAMNKGQALAVVISKGVEKPEKTIDRKLTIKYTGDEDVAGDPTKEDEEDEGEGNDSSSSEKEKTSQNIKIYLKDKTHKISDVYQSFSITEDHDVTLSFVLDAKTEGAYIIERDGEKIEQDTVVYE